MSVKYTFYFFTEDLLLNILKNFKILDLLGSYIM